MSSSAVEDGALDQWKKDRGNYKDTVHALLGFAALIVHDGKTTRPGAAFGLGRRMTRPSAENTSTEDNEVTPDLVAQRRPSYGVVAEAKASLSKDQSHWDRHAEQARKYADHLVGWWSEDETIPRYDTVLLVNISYSAALGERLEKLRATDPTAIPTTTALVEYTRQEQVTSYIFYRLHWGAISDAEFFDQLHNGKNIPIESVLASFGAIMFYDHEPPLPYLLEVLWLKVLPSLVSDQEYDHDLTSFPIPVTVEELTDEVQKAHGSKRLNEDARSVEFPTRTHIRKALDELVRLGLAEKASEEGAYTVKFKHPKEDAFTWFAKLLSKKPPKNQEAEEKGQLELFTGENGIDVS